MKIVKFVLSILFGILFINAGLDKFLHYMPMPELTEEQKAIFGAFGTLKWLMPLVGFIEVVGGLLFIFPKTKALGAIVILPVMVGIVLQNLTFSIGNSTGISISIVLLLINILILVDNKKKYQLLIS